MGGPPSCEFMIMSLATRFQIPCQIVVARPPTGSICGSCSAWCWTGGHHRQSEEPRGLPVALVY